MKDDLVILIEAELRATSAMNWHDMAVNLAEKILQDKRYRTGRRLSDKLKDRLLALKKLKLA